MRVALVAHDRFPLRAPFHGGLESFTWHLARGLRDAGVEVVLCAAPGADPGLHVEVLPVRRVELTDVARGDGTAPPDAEVQDTAAYLQVMRALARRDDVDVVHSNALHPLPVVLAPLLDVPVVATLHTPPYVSLETAVRLTPEVTSVAVSHAVASWWEPATRARVIHNGVDLEHWRPGPGGSALVWSGRIVPEKAPHVAARWARASGLPLRIAGPVQDVAYFREQLVPLLGDDVVHVGHASPEELVRLVGASAACLVTPQWDEPYGLVAAEAMAAGTPVVAVHRGGLPEVVHGAGGVTVAPDADPGAAAEAIRGVIGRDRRDVRAFAEATCSLSTMVTRYVELYDELAA